ncbi:MAG: recombinase family protein [Chthoniobacterales bacterium]
MSPQSTSDYVDDLQRRGRYGFDRGDLEKALSSSPVAATKALNRLARKNRVRKVRKGFHIIIPVEFSTPQQAEGDSLRRQLELSDKYATKHNLEIGDALRITDFGKSAYKEKHLSEGALGVFLKAVEKGEVDPGSFLLVESLDRLSRAAVPKALRLFLKRKRHQSVRKSLIIFQLSLTRPHTTQPSPSNRREAVTEAA